MAPNPRGLIDLQVLNKRTGSSERRDQMLLERIAESVGPVLAQTSSELS